MGSPFGIRKKVKGLVRRVAGRPVKRTHADVVEAPYQPPSPQTVAAVEVPTPTPLESLKVVVPSNASPLTEAQRSVVKTRAVDAIYTIFDPEIPVNIYELGLIYDVAVDEAGLVAVEMTLTSPNCPAAQSLPGEVETKTSAVEGATGASVEVVWDPPWEPSMMSEAAQLELNLV